MQHKTTTKIIWPVRAALSAVLALSCTHAADPVNIRPWEGDEYTMAIDESIPLTLWGERYARGAPSVLVIFGNDLRSWGAYQRKVHELARALSGEVEYVVIHRFLADNDRAVRLLDSRRWDTFLLWTSPEGHNHPQAAYANADNRVKSRLLHAVNAGTGMVFVMPNPPSSVCTAERRVSLPDMELFGGLSLAGRQPRTTVGYQRSMLGGRALDESAFRAAYAETYQLGAGRMVAIRRLHLGTERGDRDAEGFSWEHRVDPDYMNAELIRTLWYAAGREPRVRFAESPPARLILPWDTEAWPEMLEWRLHVDDATIRNIDVLWRVRDLAGFVHDTGQKRYAVDTGMVAHNIPIPPLGAGIYYIDVFVESEQGRENFGYCTLAVSPPFSVSLAMERAGVEPGEGLAGTVAVAGGGAGIEQERLPLRLSLIDAFERVLETQTMHLERDAPLAFALASDPHDTMQLRVRAEVRIGERTAGSSVAIVNLLQRSRNRFNFVTWGNSEGIYGHYARRHMWRAGVTAMIFGSNSADANIAYIPMIGGGNWRGELDGKPFSFESMYSVRPRAVNGTTKKASPGPVLPGAQGLGLREKALPEDDALMELFEKETAQIAVDVSPPEPPTTVPTLVPACLNDPHAMPQMLDGQRRHWTAGQQRPVHVYNLYDEGPSSAVCLDPHCLAAYRDWLREQYNNDLALLNTEWESDYSAWDDVNVLEPNTMESVREAKARERGLYARASDRSHFANVNFIRNVIGKQTEHARRFDPQAVIGFEGSGGFGMDMDELLEHAGFWVPYDGVQTEMVGTMKPRDFMYGFWIGYAKQAEPSIALTWRTLLSGGNAVWWWMTPGRGQYHGLLAPNDELYPSRRRFVETCILPLRRGLGDLLVNLDMQHDGIAIYYSRAAAYASGIDPSSDFSDARSAAQSVGRLLSDCGFQWVFTTKQRVLDGDLQARGIRLLILPFIQTLGEDEVAVLSAFVRDGGTVLADLRPGVFSGHSRPVAKGFADSLFGIERTGPGRVVRLDGVVEAQIRLAGMDHDDPTVALPAVTLSDDRADAQIRPLSAMAGAHVGETPLVLVNTIGAGQAILLNIGLDDYGPVQWYRMEGYRKMPRGTQMRAFFAGLVRALGLAPRVDCDDGSGGELLAAKTTTWTSGGLTLHGFLRDTEVTRQRSYAAGRYDEVNTPARIVLPEPGYVFDLRRGPLGHTDVVTIPEFGEVYAELLAVYAYDPGAPVVTGLPTVASAGERVTFSLRMANVPDDESALFSYHTQLIDPAGRWVDILPWSVQGAGGRAETHVRFAHNDPAGIWTLAVREVTTGRRTEVQIEKR